MKLDISRTLSLDFLGTEWKDCYIKFSYISANEAKSFMDFAMDEKDKASVEESFTRIIAVLKDKFIEGKVMSEGKVADISANDINELPTDILKKAIVLLTSGFDEDKKKD